jgi:hypothetical protein
VGRACLCLSRPCQSWLAIQSSPFTVTEVERWIKVQDVTFELERSEVALRRATGDLETWALGTK